MTKKKTKVEDEDLRWSTCQWCGAMLDTHDWDRYLKVCKPRIRYRERYTRPMSQTLVAGLEALKERGIR